MGISQYGALGFRLGSDLKASNKIPLSYYGGKVHFNAKLVQNPSIPGEYRVILEAAELDPDHDADETDDPEHEPDYEREAAEDAEIDAIDLDEEFPELVITPDDVRESRLALEKVRVPTSCSVRYSSVIITIYKLTDGVL